jgi:transposase
LPLQYARENLPKLHRQVESGDGAGHIEQVQAERIERECQRNVELVWLTGRLMPDFKTIADFRNDNGAAIRKVCRAFVLL